MKCSFCFSAAPDVKCWLWEDKPFHLVKKVRHSAAEMEPQSIRRGTFNRSFFPGKRLAYSFSMLPQTASITTCTNLFHIVNENPYKTKLYLVKNPQGDKAAYPFPQNWTKKLKTQTKPMPTAQDKMTKFTSKQSWRESTDRMPLSPNKFLFHGNK